MKPVTSPSLFSRTFHALLSLALLIPQPASAAEGDMATNTLQGLTSALNGVNGFFSAVGTSDLQLRALAAQLTQAQQQTNGVQTQQSQFENQAESSQRGVYNKNTVEYIANNQND